MTQRDPKFIVADKPVNRRTVMQQGQAAAQAPVSPIGQARLLAARTRGRLGARLADQLRAPAWRRQSPLTASAVAGGIVAACGAVGVLLGAVQSSVALAGAGAVLGLCGAVFAWRNRAGDASLAEPAPAVVLLDSDSIAALDCAFDALAPEVPAALIQPLAEFKQLVVRIARHPAAGASDEHFTLDDRMYVVECVRRYLPDSLQAYLSVPRAQRSVALHDGQTPEELLASQLALLRAQLERRESALARSAAEQLVRQHRFLQSRDS